MATADAALPDGLVTALRAILGDRLVTSAVVREHHSRGESHHPARLPDAVAYPMGTEEVHRLVIACAGHRCPVVAFGAGSSLEGHVIPSRGGLTVDLSRMTRILRLSVEDLDVTVEAGVTHKQLDRHLLSTGLMFPLDPGADATIGGMAATRASGTTAVRYGTMRDVVLGLTVVLADGRVVHTGSRARKSSAGYDLTRLFVGSEGTLGIITEVTLRLHGRPEAVAAASCWFDDIESAVRVVITTIQLGIPVARMELLDEVLMAAVNRHSALDCAVAPTLFVEFHGLSAQDVSAQVDEFAAIAAANGGHDVGRALSPERRAALWQARHDAYYAALALRPGARGWTTDVCVPISRLADCIRETKADLAGSPLVGPLVGHAGDGNFHLIFPVHPDDAAEMAEAERLTHRLVDRALAMGGTCTGEHGVGLGKRKFMEREHGPEALSVMRAIKQALDPLGLLNPGKVIPE
ncbi:MAG TPA: FAD-linked oxidase C-terminal domain-containing protein [Vicinamibacterales bacterium]|nr:FAD-linked oxidase C-terminal domain-containing protein [Vicinamibacterales bacterium]